MANESKDGGGLCWFLLFAGGSLVLLHIFVVRISEEALHRNRARIHVPGRRRSHHFAPAGFNEYVFNTAVIAVLVPVLARTAVLIWELKQSGKAAWPRASLLVLAGLVSLNWGYQLILMSVSPGKYIERSTPGRWRATSRVGPRDLE